MPAEESLLPEPHHEAEAIIKGIQAIAAARWHDRAYELVDATGQKVITAEGPSEIASWVFPHETQEEDEKRAALRTDIEALLDAIRERARSIGYTMSDLDERAQTTPFFRHRDWRSWVNRAYGHLPCGRSARRRDITPDG